jgi:CRP/FNR family transcriptional regulator, cyclic AMP receptor protein
MSAQSAGGTNGAFGPMQLQGALSVLPPEDVAWLEARSTLRELDRDEILMRQGERGDHVAVVLAGRFRVVVTTRTGRSILLAVRGPGTMMGDLAAIDGGPRSATVSALEPARVRTIANALVREVVRRRPEVMWSMLVTTAGRLRAADMRFVGVATDSTRTRVARVLLEIGAQHGKPTDDGIRVDLPVSQEELASLVAASREGVNAALSQLRREGTITTRRMAVTIQDLDALREVALGG